MSIDLIEMWHRRVRPHPTDKDLNTQLGCHVEEFTEMLEALALTNYNLTPLMDKLIELSEGLKHGTVEVVRMERDMMLDSIADQVVTAVGVGHCAHMGVTEAVRRVNTSNWTKFDTDGKPIRDANGKIMKGPNYKAPELGDLV